MLLSITRLRLARWKLLPGFFKVAASCEQQAVADPACVGVAKYTGPGPVFWTATLWRSELEMRNYLSTGAQREALPLLSGWCSEACTAQLSVDTLALPTRDELPGYLSRRAKFIPVKEPSPLQQSAIVPPGMPWIRRVLKTHIVRT
jgi:hypothetical protein